MLLQFLLKMFRSFLRRFFVSLKKFLIFSSNWRGDSLKFPTQAWKKSGGPPLVRRALASVSRLLVKCPWPFSHLSSFSLLLPPSPLP